MDLSNGTVLVTGANGFVGTYLCRDLLRQGVHILGGVRTFPGRGKAVEGVDYVRLNDIAENNTNVFAEQNIDAVVHLAARVHIMSDTDASHEEEYRKVNTEGTLRLAAAAAENKVKRFVFLSTIKVNGEFTIENPFAANDLPSPQGAYAQSKFLAEEGLKKIANETGMEIVIIRSPLVYGAGAGGNFGMLVQKVRSGWYFPLAGINNKRSLVYAGNLVDLLCTCLKSNAAPGKTFLVSDDHDVSTPELIEAIAKESGRSRVLFYFPPFLLRFIGKLAGKGNQVRRLMENLQVDYSYTKKQLAWRPPFSFEEGISRSLQ